MPMRPSSRSRSLVGWVSIGVSSVVVAAAADVAVPDGRLVGRRFRARQTVEAAAQDRLHRAAGGGADVDPTLAGRLDAPAP